jgi:cytochrome c-type biogenesis protein CcmH/NrfG
LDLAGESLQALIQRHPAQAEAHLLLGDVWLAEGHVPAALEQYKATALSRPKDPKIHDTIGRAYIAAKQYDRALDEFEQALSLDPNLVDALAGVASVDWMKADPSRAIGRVREQIEESPKNPRLHDLLGSLYLSTGEFANAEQSFTAAIRLDPKRPRSYLLLGDT